MAATSSVLLLTLFLFGLRVLGDGNNVPVTMLQDATQKGAVCLDGSPGAYYYAAGSGQGLNSWILYLMGGGWCNNINLCKIYRGSVVGSSNNLSSMSFVGLLSSNQNVNPDFYNWNRVFVHYCDGASFLGDSENLDQGFQFRGSKIFEAVVDELLEKGMKCATNAILSGSSAGGLACMLHCDGFRASLPNTASVKCISDAGFFIHGKELPLPKDRENKFADLILFHNLSNYLPTSCTSRMDAKLCLFPEYFAGDIQTPLFILNSEFDSYQISANLNPDYSDSRWKNCTLNLNVCAPLERQLITDFGRAFLNSLKRLPCNPSRGEFVITCYFHVLMSSDEIWNFKESPTLANKTIAQGVGDWYFGRSTVWLIDVEHDFPPECAAANQTVGFI